MNCDIIKDLLPLYCDGVCSTESAKAVEEHLTDCHTCRNILEKMRDAPPVSETIRTEIQTEAKVLRGVKRKFTRKRLRAVLVTVLVALTTMAILIAASDEEKPIPYQDGLVTADLAVDEAIDLYFYGNHYASFWAFHRDTEEHSAIYFCYTQTLKSSATPIFGGDHGHICIGNAGMSDFSTATYQVPYSQDIDAVYYLEASQQDYLRLPQMSDEEFVQASQNAVLLWDRADG